MPDSQRPHGLQPTRLLRPGIFQARVLEWDAIAFSIIYTTKALFINKLFYLVSRLLKKYKHRHKKLVSLCSQFGYLEHKQ